MPRDYFGNYPIVSGLGFSRDVLLLDDCEGTCAWTKNAIDANATVTFETAAAFTGTYGLQLYSGDATPELGDTVTATRSLSYPEVGLLVARCRLAIPTLATLAYLDLILQAWDGAHEYYGTLRLDPNTPETSYVGADGNWHALADLAYTPYAGAWMTLELALDVAAKRYLHAIYGGTKVDLSALDLYDAGAQSPRMSQVQLQVTTAGAAATTAYADNIYVGQIPEA